MPPSDNDFLELTLEALVACAVGVEHIVEELVPLIQTDKIPQSPPGQH